MTAYYAMVRLRRTRPFPEPFGEDGAPSLLPAAFGRETYTVVFPNSKDVIKDGVSVPMTLLVIEEAHRLLTVGTKFKILEGTRVISIGEVEEIRTFHLDEGEGLLSAIRRELRAAGIE